MTRESRELYQDGDEAMVGTYRDLTTGKLVHIYTDRELLPSPEHGVTVYEWISEHPDWDDEEDTD